MITVTTQSPVQTFTVWSNEIKGRLDCSFFFNRSFMREGQNYQPIPLGSLLVESPQYGANVQAIAYAPDTDVRYIRITDIDEFGELRLEAVTAKTIDEKYLLDEGDLLFARSGATAGKCFLYQAHHPKSIFAGYLIRFRIACGKALPKFVFYYCQSSMYANWVKTIIRPSGQPNINSEEFKSLRIPLPPLEVQQQIVDIMDAAYAEKREKEECAQALLDSFDGYVLGELGIKLPVTEDQMTFTVWSDELEDRIDPRSYSVKNPFLLSSYPLVQLTEHILLNPGRALLAVGGTHTFVPMGNISEESLSITNFLEIEEENSKGYTPFQEGDLILAKITPCMENGKMAIAKGMPITSAFGSTEFHVFREKDGQLSVRFLMELFHLKAFRGFAQAHFSGSAGQQRVAPTFFERLQAPFAPVEIQKQIADETSRRREEAKRLREEARQALDAAKATVERMILGDDQ